MQLEASQELQQLLARLVTLEVTSREDLKHQVSALLQDNDLEMRDTHNTKSILFIFKAAGIRYGLKIEYGEAEVVRDEAHWYELAPADLKPHYIISHNGDDYAFVLLRWLHNARTIEEIAIANEGKNTTETMDLIIKALDQDKELFNSHPTISLLTTKTSSYFLNKYHSYNAPAKDFPYLQKLLTSDSVRLNGRELPGPYMFVQAVQQNDELRNHLSPDKAGLIHGDSQVDNLLVEDGVVYMVDPKGVDHLPLEYDHGRIIWAFTGWNAIVRGEFELSEHTDGYNLEVTRRSQYIEGQSRLQAYFTDQEYHRAMYSAAMQYLTRIHHAAVESETKALYLRGLELFDQLFDELGVKI